MCKTRNELNRHIHICTVGEVESIPGWTIWNFKPSELDFVFFLGKKVNARHRFSEHWRRQQHHFFLAGVKPIWLWAWLDWLCIGSFKLYLEPWVWISACDQVLNLTPPSPSQELRYWKIRIGSWEEKLQIVARVEVEAMMTGGSRPGLTLSRKFSDDKGS